MKRKENRTIDIRKAAGCAVFMAVLLGSMVLAGCKKEETPDPGAAAASESVSSAAQSTGAAEDAAVSAAESSSSVQENTAAAPEAAASTAEKIMLLDNDVVQLTLNGVSPFPAGQEDDGTTKTADPEVEISFDVTNKRDEEIVLDLRDLKVGGTDVRRILVAGDIVTPGDTMTFRYGVLPQEQKQAGEEGAAEGPEPVTWEMVSEQGMTGTVRVMNLEGELAKAEFSTKE